MKIRINKTFTSAVVGCIVLTAPLANADLVLQLEAENFVSGTWTATVGPNATGAGPALAAGVTPNGSDAVRFGGPGLQLAGGGLLTPTAAVGYTLFAVLSRDPAATGASGHILATDNTANLEPNLQWRLLDTTPGADSTFKPQNRIPGISDTTLSNEGEFHILAFQLSGSATSFRTDGVAGATGGGATGLWSDDTVTGSARSLEWVGTRWGVEGFEGDIAELRVYEGQLTLPEIQAVENELNLAHIAIPEPSSLALLSGGLIMLSAYRRRQATKKQPV